MFYCKYCGSKLNDDAFFCIKCGKRIENHQEEDVNIEQTTVHIKEDGTQQRLSKPTNDITKKFPEYEWISTKTMNWKKPIALIVFKIVCLSVFGFFFLWGIIWAINGGIIERPTSFFGTQEYFVYEPIRIIFIRKLPDDVKSVRAFKDSVRRVDTMREREYYQSQKEYLEGPTRERKYDGSESYKEYSYGEELPNAQIKHKLKFSKIVTDSSTPVALTGSGRDTLTVPNIFVPDIRNFAIDELVINAAVKEFRLIIVFTMIIPSLLLFYLTFIWTLRTRFPKQKNKLIRDYADYIQKYQWHGFILPVYVFYIKDNKFGIIDASKYDILIPSQYDYMAWREPNKTVDVNINGEETTIDIEPFSKKLEEKYKLEKELLKKCAQYTSTSTLSHSKAQELHERLKTETLTFEQLKEIECQIEESCKQQ